MDDFEDKTVQKLRGVTGLARGHKPIHNKEAYQKLREAEKEYLLANDWIQEVPEADEWDHEGFNREAIPQGHAVNVQKQFDRIFHQHR